MSAASFRFLHAADLHLDSPLSGLVRRGETAAVFVEASRRALENLVAVAIEEKVAFVVIAGDVYDGDWKDYATGQFFVRQMGRLARAGIRVFLIRGNHDAESVITRNLPLPSNVHSFSVQAVESVRIEELRVALHGRSFKSRHVVENVALAYPPAVPGYVNIGVLHTSLTGREGHADYAPCSVEDLRRAGYDYWALGHIHRREVVAADPLIVFPGNLQGRHARETGAKGATLVEVRDGRIITLEALELDAARFDHVELDLTGFETAGEVIGAAREAFAQALERAGGRPLALRVSLIGRTALHDHLCATAGQLREDLQAIAFEGAADLMIEKVRHATTGSPRDGIPAIAGFEDMLATVAADPAFRAEVAAVLAQLHARAPADALDLLGAREGGPEARAEEAIAAARENVLGALGDFAAAEGEP